MNDQRFTIATQDLPLHVLMREIVKTLSHSPASAKESTYEYEWRKTQDKDQYILVGLVSPSLQQRRALALEKERIKTLLGELRDLLSQSPQDAAKSETATHFIPQLLDRSDPAFAIYHQALCRLSDRDIDVLVRGGDVPVSAALLTEAVQTFNQEMQKAYEKMPPTLIGQITVKPPVPLEVAASPRLRLRPNNFNGVDPGRWYEYTLLFDDVFRDQWMTIDPNYSSKPPLTAPDINEPLLDLTPASLPQEERPKESGLHERDLSATLIAIAHAAKINVVQEHYYKVDQLSGPIRGLPANQQKGKLTTLLNNVCRTWNYTAVKEGNVYRLWSPTWLVDKDCNITERKLKPWRALLARQGKFTIDDQIRMATEFTWGQIVVTLKQALPADTNFRQEDGMERPTYFPQLIQVEQYYPLRLQGLINPEERQAALSDAGVPVAALRPSLLEETFRAILIQDRTPPTQNQVEALRSRFLTARLLLRPPSPGFRKPQPMSVQILAAPK